MSEILLIYYIYTKIFFKYKRLSLKTKNFLHFQYKNITFDPLNTFSEPKKFN